MIVIVIVLILVTTFYLCVLLIQWRSLLELSVRSALFMNHIINSKPAWKPVNLLNYRNRLKVAHSRIEIKASYNQSTRFFITIIYSRQATREIPSVISSSKNTTYRLNRHQALTKERKSPANDELESHLLDVICCQAIQPLGFKLNTLTNRRNTEEKSRWL